MAYAKVNASNVIDFKSAINSEIEYIITLVNQADADIDNLIEIAEKKIDKTNETIKKANDKKNKIDEKLEKAKQKLADLKDELSVTPPTILIAIDNDKGKPILIEVPNPKYEELVDKIEKTEDQIEKLQSLCEELDIFIDKCHEIADKLSDAENRLIGLGETIHDKADKLQELREDATYQLTKIANSVNDYLNIRIKEFLI